MDSSSFEEAFWAEQRLLPSEETGQSCIDFQDPFVNHILEHLQSSLQSQHSFAEPPHRPARCCATWPCETEAGAPSAWKGRSPLILLPQARIQRQRTLNALIVTHFPEPCAADSSMFQGDDFCALPSHPTIWDESHISMADSSEASPRESGCHLPESLVRRKNGVHHPEGDRGSRLVEAGQGRVVQPAPRAAAQDVAPAVQEPAPWFGGHKGGVSSASPLKASARDDRRVAALQAELAHYKERARVAVAALRDAKEERSALLLQIRQLQHEVRSTHDE